jgi:hypothetical protein
MKMSKGVLCSTVVMPLTLDRNNVKVGCAKQDSYCFEDLPDIFRLAAAKPLVDYKGLAKNHCR